MKKYLFTLICILFIGTASGYAQGDNHPGRFILGASWQFNSHINNENTSHLSGWGVMLESGYHITPRFDAGVFVGWHTNRTDYARQTYQVDDFTVNTDMLYAYLQIPAGVFANFNFTPHKLFEPYIGLKVGFNYSDETYYHNVFKQATNDWGLYIAPEIGAVAYPFRMGRLCGFKVSVYYSVSNNTPTASKSNVQNWGIRIGLIGRI